MVAVAWPATWVTSLGQCRTTLKAHSDGWVGRYVNDRSGVADSAHLAARSESHPAHRRDRVPPPTLTRSKLLGEPGGFNPAIIFPSHREFPGPMAPAAIGIARSAR